MNIDNINNPIDPKRQIDRDQQTQRIRTDRQKPAQTEQKQQVAGDTAIKDTVDLSRDTRLVEELTAAVENMEEPPREDLINRVRERIESGQYDSAETAERIAASLLDFTIRPD